MTTTDTTPTAEQDRRAICAECGDLVTYYWRFADGSAVCPVCPVGDRPGPVRVVDALHNASAAVTR